MTQSRRWSGELLCILLTVLIAAGCAPPDSGGLLPAFMDPIALRDSILDSVSIAQFESGFGQNDKVVNTTLGILKTKGTIHPERNSYQATIRHRKILARIMVDKDYRGLKKDVWNYWAIVDTSTNNSGKWVSVWAIPDNPLVVRAMTPRTHRAGHPNARARWISHSAAVPWATCALTTCCCEGTKCNAL